MNVYPENTNQKVVESPSIHHMSSAQFSLSLDHVVEMILRRLNLFQLFKVRLLSRQWNSLASVLIQKRVEIVFYERHNPSTRTLNKSKNILHKKITELDSLPLDPRSNFQFPVNNFTFYFLDIYNNSQVTRFLNIHGPHIKKLALQSCLGRTEAQLMDFVANLLSKQTRNLEILTLCVRATDIEWKTKMRDDEDYEDERYRLDASTAPLLPKDPEFFDIYSCFQYENPQSKLRVFEIDSEISAKIFEVVCRMSPKLEEIIIDSYHAPFLVTPVNRAHVFKTFCSSGWSSFFRDDEIYEFLQFLNVKNRLRLKTIVLRHADVFRSYEIEKSWNNLVDVINYLFKISCDSIESLGWINLSCLKNEGIVWRPMRNLKKLTLGRYGDGFYCPTRPRPRHIFPMGFSPAKTFPQLETVQLCIHTQSYGQRDNLTDFLRSLNFERTQSVRVVDVREDSPAAQITYEHARKIRNLFPLARIVTGRTCTRDPYLCFPCSC